MARTSAVLQWEKAIFRVAPELALKLAQHRAGRMLKRMRKGKLELVPAVEELQSLLGPDSEQDWEETLRRNALCQARSRLLREMAYHHGIESLGGLVVADPASQARIQGLMDEGRPAIVATWHPGPDVAVWTFLASFGMPVILMRNQQWGVLPAHWEIVKGSASAAEGIRLLRLSIERLRGGSWLATAFDHSASGTRRRIVPCFGRDVRFTTAIGWLSQHTGAPIALVSAHWSKSGYRVVVKVEDVLEPGTPAGVTDPELEDATLAKLAGHMERFIRRYPWELSGLRCRNLLGYPPTGSGRTAAHEDHDGAMRQLGKHLKKRASHDTPSWAPRGQSRTARGEKK